jgi:hypothetical protein
MKPRKTVASRTTPNQKHRRDLRSDSSWGKRSGRGEATCSGSTRAHSSLRNRWESQHFSIPMLQYRQRSSIYLYRVAGLILLDTRGWETAKDADVEANTNSTIAVTRQSEEGLIMADEHLLSALPDSVAVSTDFRERLREACSGDQSRRSEPSGRSLLSSSRMASDSGCMRSSGLLDAETLSFRLFYLLVSQAHDLVLLGKALDHLWLGILFWLVADGNKNGMRHRSMGCSDLAQSSTISVGTAIPSFPVGQQDE